MKTTNPFNTAFSRRPNAIPTLVSGLVVAAGLIPVGFLLIRACGLTESAAVLVEQETWWALWRTFALGLGTGIFCSALSLPLAWWTHATDLPGRRFFRVALNLPLAVPSYVGGFVILVSFAPGGWWDVLFSQSVSIYGGLGAFLAIAFTFPLALLNLQSALSRMDPRLWEAARSLGATPGQAFWRVVFPQLKSAFARGTLLVSLYAVGDFGAVSLLRYKSLSYLIYVRYKSLFGRGEAVWLSLLLVVVAVILVTLLIHIGGKSAESLSTQATVRVWPVIQLGKWKHPAFAFCTSVVSVGVCLPVCVVCFWLLRGIVLGNPPDFSFEVLGASLWVSGAAAIMIVGLGIFPTILSKYFSRQRSYFRMQIIMHLGYALPGIVVALSFVSFSVKWTPILYQSFPLLFLAYAVRFFPLAVHTMDDALSTQNQNLFRAARGLGCSPWQAVARVIVPEMKPAVVVAAVAIFITVLKELPLTLILRPIGVQTLATHIWALTEDAYFGAVSLSVLLLLMLAAMGLLLRPMEKKGL